MDRLDKFLVECGAGSRTQVKGILKAGRVTVDGLPERDPSRKIDPQTQEIRLDGGILAGRRRVVAMLNKPAGFVTATEDAASTEPRETHRVITTASRNRPQATRPTRQSTIMVNTPPQRMPLPPWKRKVQGNTCPTMQKQPAQ